MTKLVIMATSDLNCILLNNQELHTGEILFCFFCSLLCLCYSDKGCQMKGFEVCNLTIQTALDQFPSLIGCACAYQEDLCASM